MPTLKTLAAKLGFELLARSAVIPMAIAQRRSSRRGLAIDGDGPHTHPDQLYISSKLGALGSCVGHAAGAFAGSLLRPQPQASPSGWR